MVPVLSTQQMGFTPRPGFKANEVESAALKQPFDTKENFCP
jgi:hypothetical protein